MVNQELFDYCKQLETECSNAFLYDVGTEQWDEKRQAMYAHGSLLGLYRENSRFLRNYLKQDTNREELLIL